MAPNKFEQHIKKQLESREIPPSSDAWLKVSDRLDESSAEPPKKRGFFWYAVAACFIGLIVLSTVFFSGRKSVMEPPIQVVEETTKEGQVKEERQKTETLKVPVEMVTREASSEEPTRSTAIENRLPVPAAGSDTEPLADGTLQETIPLNENSEDLINTKLLEVLAQVDALEQNQEQITDAEVDSLLRKAQEELLSEALFRTDRSVDAMALLSEVEGELDKSFRDQIFESLKSGFLKVRTAVADRNN